MKRSTAKLNNRRFRSSQQRRAMLKKLHQKVMQRRQLFQGTELNQAFNDELSEAC